MIAAIIRALFGSRTKKAATGTAAASVLAAAMAFVGPWEGMKTEAYLDRIAQPPVWTVCYGETRGVTAGSRHTPDQCAAMLMDGLADFRTALIGCIPSLPDQPQGVQVALTSWAFNVGTGAGCRSTLARRANAGDWRAACDQLLRWDRAGGVVVRGLTNRRQAEHRLCVGAL